MKHFLLEKSWVNQWFQILLFLKFLIIEDNSLPGLKLHVTAEERLFCLCTEQCQILHDRKHCSIEGRVCHADL